MTTLSSSVSAKAPRPEPSTTATSMPRAIRSRMCRAEVCARSKIEPVILALPEIQPRRYEGREVFFCSSFVPFVSWWLTFIFHLLLHIRYSQGLRRRRAADPPRQHDHRQNVRDHLNELVGDVYSSLHTNRDRLGEAEEEAGDERADRIPFAEDQCGQRDESAPGGHVAGEERILADGQIGAAEAGERARNQHSRITHSVDAHPCGERRLGIFAND